MVDPALQVLQERGREHEREYVATLTAQGLLAADLSEHEGTTAHQRAIEAMRSGAQIIKPGQAQVYLPGDIHDTLCVAGPALLFRFTERDLKREDLAEHRVKRYIQQGGFWTLGEP